ncbi:hypothetical protein M427DRAFT_140433 [Gonapodya prolifera JEL478]|uniref:Uncharacterized protein n=1 Tax=Gonapodya prolifera (strain JEL478) TaxID=1344416 RepID=A0A138ZZ41_GONPJ|nr:hypothetical protein M427DRAFT_140433 [Gonapodya prolifera JEL478]|eukprot:KXS09776.1 hypothetical protein M427DRAFT_140433 [Gonapodya prolifera JEL478]
MSSTVDSAAAPSIPTQSENLPQNPSRTFTQSPIPTESAGGFQPPNPVGRPPLGPPKVLASPNPAASVPPPFWVKKDKDGPSCILCETPLSRITAWYVDRHAVSGRHVAKLREAQAEGKYLDVDLTPMQVQLRIAAAAAGQQWGPGGLLGGDRGGGSGREGWEEGGEDEGYDALLGPPQQYSESRWKSLMGNGQNNNHPNMASVPGRGGFGGLGGRDVGRGRGPGQDTVPRFDENGLPMRSGWDTLPAHRKHLGGGAAPTNVTGIDAMVPAYEDVLRSQQQLTWPSDPGSLAILFPMQPQQSFPTQPQYPNAMGMPMMGTWQQTPNVTIPDAGVFRR